MASDGGLRLASHRIEKRMRQGFSRRYAILVVIAEHAVEQVEPIRAVRLPSTPGTTSFDATPRLFAVRSQHVQQSRLQDNV